MSNAAIRPLPFIIILMVLDHVAFNGSRIAVMLYAIFLGESALTVGTLLALYALLPAIFSVAAGRWIDRIGIIRPMQIGSIGVGIGTILPFLWTGVGVLYAACVIVGLAFMLVNVAAYHAVGELSQPEDRAVNFSYVALGYSTSLFIAPILSGVGIDSVGYRNTFALLAAFTVLPIAVLSLKLLPVPAPTVKPEGSTAGNVLDLLREPQLRRLYVTMAVLTVAWDVYSFAIPVHGSLVGLSASEIGLVMASFAAATFVVRLAMPFFVQHIKPWTMLICALLTAGLSFFLLPFATTVGAMMALMFSLGLGLGSPQPMMLTLLHESAPAGRAAEALGLRTTLINGSQTVIPLIFGGVGAALGMMPVFWTMSAALVLGSYYAHRASRVVIKTDPGA
ncbi:MAG: MFS transporter [Burkholderiales bacterium]|nr:MFS transporter [Burkholderiales bacterium]